MPIMKFKPARFIRSRHHWVVTAVALGAAFGVCGCGKKQANSLSTVPDQHVHVTVLRVTSRNVPIVLSETGTFVADEISDVAPAVAGRVIKTPVSVGAFVKTGEVLCQLDPRDAELKLAQMKAQYEEGVAAVRQAQQRIGLNSGMFHADAVPEVAAAKSNYEASQAQAKLAAADAKRYANLIATGDVSQSVYDQKKTAADTAAAQADQANQQYIGALNIAKLNFQGLGSSQASLDAMRAQVFQAEKALSDTTVRAPFDGFISARPVAAGEFVATTSKVATIVRIGMLKLQMQVGEKNAAGLRTGMPVTARVSAYGDRDFQGVTSAVNPAVNPDSRAFVLEAQFTNPDGELKPGMFANAHVALPGTEPAIFIPKAAVFRDLTTDSNQVFVVEDGRARMRVVTLGEIEAGQIRVLSGVSGGQIIAVDKQTSLYDGAPVIANGTW